MATAAKSTASTLKTQATRVRTAQRKKITSFAKGKQVSQPGRRKLRIRG